MNRTDYRWGALVGVAVALLVSGPLFVLEPVLPVGELGTGLIGGVTGVVAGVAAVQRARRSRTDEGSQTEDSTDEAASHNVWDAIPSWQYDGRHVESGGFTRAEQEEAIEEINETAAKKLDEAAAENRKS